MIPCLLWSCHHEKSRIQKCWMRSELKSCKTSRNGHEGSIKNMILLSGVMSFVINWSTMNVKFNRSLNFTFKLTLTLTHACMFVCLLFVCLCTGVFDSMLMLMLRCMKTKETAEKLTHHHGKKEQWLSILCHFATFEFWPCPTFQGTAPPCEP